MGKDRKWNINRATYFGYVVVIRSIIPIPISYPLAFVGAVWFVMALIRKIYVAINE